MRAIVLLSVQTETYSGNLEEVFRRENMNIKKNLCASVCVNIFVLGIFLLMLQQLDVFMQLLFSFVTIILSLIVSTLINRDKDPEKDNYLQCAAICSGFNFISLVVEYICITAVTGANDIYEVSQKYNSEYVTVSENNSPIFSIIVFSIVSFALHYFVMKKAGNKKG